MTWLSCQRLLFAAVITTLVFFAIPLSAGAAQELNLPAATVPETVEFPSIIWLFIKMVFSLIVIAGLAYLMVRLLKKNLHTPTAGEWFTIVDQFPLGMNKGVFLAEIAGKAYILGVTDHNITILGEFDDQERLDEIKRQVQAREQLPPAAQNLLRTVANYLTKGWRRKPGDFHNHILKQIQRLQSMSAGPSEKGRREDDRDA